MKRKKIDWKGLVRTVAVTLILVAFVACGVVWSAHERQKEQNACRAEGGTVVEVQSGRNGTEWFCDKP